MKQSITCRCDEVFEEEIPEVISLDKTPNLIEEILLGNFMSVKCPSCKIVLPLEFPCVIEWEKVPTKNKKIQFIPLKDKISFFNKTVDIVEDGIIAIGYQELVEKVTILREDLNLTVIEALKVYLLEKSLSELPDKRVSFIFNSIQNEETEKSLLFYAYGLKENEIAKINIPFSLYESEIKKYQENTNNDLYSALNNNGYISASNVNFEET